jgi:hypothetical protein
MVISMDGKLFHVRQNLFDLLEILHREAKNEQAGTTPYWIDALCIDQRNDLERNHQVAQMGEIFSSAVCVHMWLGKVDNKLIPAIHALRKSLISIPSPSDWHAVQTNANLVEKYVINNGYFRRAWITQEVLVARSVLVRLDTESLSLKGLTGGMEYFRLFEKNASNIRSSFSQFMIRWRKPFRHENLISLLEEFRDKECENNRDRIFSLLSLCTNESDRIDVDYRASPIEIAANVLCACSKSLCLCSTVLVLQTLGIREMPSHMWPWETTMSTGPYIEFDVTSAYNHHNAHKWSLKSYQGSAKDLLMGDEAVQFLNIIDICESTAVGEFHVSWVSGGPLINWSHHKHYPRQDYRRRQGTIRHGEGFEFMLRDDRCNIFVVRIALALLAQLVTREVDLCIQAKLPRRRRRDVDTGFPRIRPSFETPGMETTIRPLPPLNIGEHVTSPLLLQNGQPEVPSPDGSSHRYRPAEKPRIAPKPFPTLLSPDKQIPDFSSPLSPRPETQRSTLLKPPWHMHHYLFPNYLSSDTVYPSKPLTWEMMSM